MGSRNLPFKLIKLLGWTKLQLSFVTLRLGGDRRPILRGVVKLLDAVYADGSSIGSRSTGAC